MIAVVMIIVIGIVGFAVLVNDNGSTSNSNSTSSVSEDGVVNDMYMTRPN